MAETSQKDRIKEHKDDIVKILEIHGLSQRQIEIIFWKFKLIRRQEIRIERELQEKERKREK